MTLHAQVPSNLEALVGEPARYIDQDMEKYGYTHIKTTKSDYDSYSSWWKGQSRKCVCVRTNNGNVASVVMSMPFDCNKHTERNVSYNNHHHSQHHHSNGSHYTSVNVVAAFERGFSDGIHNKTYHNIYSSSDSEIEAYANGYSKGVAQRTHNTSYHSSRGGYASHVRVNDLVNEEPQWAYKQLKSRGFAQQRHHNANHKTYNVWNNPKTGQCILSIASSERIMKIENSTRCY